MQGKCAAERKTPVFQTERLDEPHIYGLHLNTRGILTERELDGFEIYSLSFEVSSEIKYRID